MADYSKLKVSAVYSENSDYSDPRLQTSLEAYTSTTATHYMQLMQTVGTAAAETLTLDNFTTIEYVIVKNKDATNYVTVTISDSAGLGTTDTVVRVAAGRLLVTPDVTGGSGKTITLQANTAACDVEVIVVGT